MMSREITRLGTPTSFGQPREAFRTCRSATRRHCTRSLKVRAGVFDFLRSGGSAGSGKAAELRDELFKLSRSGGSGEAKKQQVAELAQQLKRFRPGSAAKNPQFYGNFEVIYASNPNATGGPIFGSGPGKVVFGAQRPRQSIDQSGELTNNLQFRTLWLLPGSAKQKGTVSVTGGNNYTVTFDAQAVNKGESLRRRFEVLYLDDQAKIVQFLPEQKDRESVLFVLKRVAESPRKAQTSSGNGTTSAQPKPPSATRKIGRPAQKQVKASTGQKQAKAGTEQNQANAGIGQKQAKAEPAQKQAKAGTGQRQAKSGTGQKQARADSGQVKEFAESLKGVQEQNKAVSSDLREAEKKASQAARSARPAQAQIEKAQKDVSDLEQQIAGAVEAARAADQRYNQALDELRQAARASR